MRSFAFAAILVFTFEFAHADGVALQLLQRDLGNSIEVVSKNEIRYCPDNTCEIIKSKKPDNFLPVFLYLYLFHESGYVELGKSYNGKKPFRESAIEESDIRNNASSFCANTHKSPHCILASMRKQLNIQICTGRYDEGEFCVSCGTKTNCKKL